ncbi:chorismate synthase [Corynebacterium phocae]|uniref:Chorismate synthase n=1 Tax=Corynebacterium phocae TaxID=161895 RepID=A0A1L7D2X7_9CORY|nr:chorismate synthase [Corynebacterium phocae]APT92445.1 chorismate synthase [Corynebacterium phocae]KAA8725046.1 chorismate synthase [Corynebacterium phocae]
MLRWTTAGESHGQALIAMVENLPSGIPVTAEEISHQLARRRLGYGRGARMKFEQDELTLLSGIVHGKTIGSPIAIMIGNSEWPKWTTIMSPHPLDPEDPATQAALTSGRGAKLTRPRPGHADFAGMVKYNHDGARPILERSSARETAARVAAATLARNFLRETLGVEVFSHVVSIGASTPSAAAPSFADLNDIDSSPVRSASKEAEESMVAEIESAKKAGDTLGGIVEVVVSGLPVGLGSHISGEARLDAQLAAALMGIQSVKGVEVGDGFEEARRRGTQAHDEMVRETQGGVGRLSNRAGGLEGGMTNGQDLRLRAAMKPISTVPRALKTVDMSTGAAATAIHQRSDVCAVPAGGVVAEAMVALVLARAVLEKFGGDSLAETKRNAESYLDYVSYRLSFEEEAHD